MALRGPTEKRWEVEGRRQRETVLLRCNMNVKRLEMFSFKNDSCGLFLCLFVRLFCVAVFL